MEPFESSASTQQRGRINWMQRSRDLENVGTVLSKPEDCLEYKNATLIGIDPGVRYPITATKIDPLDNNKRHNVRISSASLNRPYHLFCQQLEERKRQAGISQLESQIPSLSISTVQEYFIYLCTSSVPASMTVPDRITSFYRDRWYRWARWNMKRGQNGCLDVAIKRLLRMASGTEGAKKKTTIKSIFSVGLAQFSGSNSKHTKLLRRFILKAKALEYTVVGIHEYFTSAKCPKNRSKYCQTCQVYLDRDAVGSENIAWVLNGHVQCQLRPSKFMPTSSPATPTRPSQAPLASYSRKHS
ncbi:hypothetical protein B0O80DRAFT_528763 [Mortierella sp. GBAus27b]|nr:hypothetical protein B0O80DRAFT_528763 [Mortierella sp. GBAus27b]